MAGIKHTPHRGHRRNPAVRRKLRKNGHDRQFPEAREQLEDHIRGLQTALSTVIVAITALRRQNSDFDADIARVLEHAAADRLDIEIEGLRRWSAAPAAERSAGPG